MPRLLTVARLMSHSLWHYWPTNLAITLGVAIGAAVIGGALIVGDSVRASLKQLTLDRLGQIDDVVTGPRFFRERLVDDLQSAVAGKDAASSLPSRMAAAIVLVGGIERRTDKTVRRAGHASFYGLDARGWELIAHSGSPPPSGNDAFINTSLAEALQAKIGDEITLWIELPSAVPRDTLLGKRDNDSQEVTVRVAQILADGPGAPRLGFQPTQQLPFNVFVDLERLQEALNQEAARPTRANPTGSLGRVNTIFAAQSPDIAHTGAGAQRGGESATEWLRSVWQLRDLQLRLVHDRALQVLSLESEQMLLEDRLAHLALRLATEQRRPVSPVLVYLANWFRNPRNPAAVSMYSTVAGLDVLDLDEAFGTFEFVGPMPDTLGDGDVILNEWLAQDLQVQVGDAVRFGYHVVGSHGELPEEERTVTVRGIVRMTGPAIDPQLTPEVKGITDADSLDNWDQPFPMKLNEVTKRDDEYWEQHRATPKAFFALQTAQRLWPSRYGSYTSVRIGLKPEESVAEAEEQLSRALLARLDPAEVGLAFQPVKLQGLRAASGSNDFSVLFLSFSFFLILSAVILVGLLFRLAVEQRVRQWGLLGAVGLAPGRVRTLMLAEGAVLVLIGGACGAGASVGYAHGMVYGLKTWWIGAIGTKFLLVDVRWSAVLLGVIAAAAASFAAIGWGLRQLRGISLREQLAGVAEREAVSGGAPSSNSSARRALLSGGAALALIGGSLTGIIPASEAFGGFSWPVLSFFVAGLLLLSCGLWTMSAWLQADAGIAVRGRGFSAMIRLGGRNAARRRQRSVLTTGLIASAAFVIAAVAAAQHNPARERPDLRSGNGGFTLVAEASTPILYDLNTPEGRQKLNLIARTPAQTAALAAMKVVAFRIKPGEDASCLNLYQTRAPTILGVPQTMIDRGGFAFVGGGDETWKKLNGEKDGADLSVRGEACPVLGDMNTLQFSLHKAVGDRVPYPASDNTFLCWLDIQGMFSGSVFQGVLLMSEEKFLRVFPERKGYQYFLVEVPPEHATAAAELLETELAEYGFDAEPVAERLARFLAVQNTYLSTFQSLGGLGLLVGTFGLATVMLRNVLERQAELALFRAVGFRPSQIATLVLSETAWLLGWGLLTGTAAALLAMTPHLVSMAADVPWSAGAGMLLTIAGVGLFASALAVRAATTAPIVATLRGE